MLRVRQLDRSGVGVERIIRWIEITCTDLATR